MSSLNLFLTSGFKALRFKISVSTLAHGNAFTRHNSGVPCTELCDLSCGVLEGADVVTESFPDERF